MKIKYKLSDSHFKIINEVLGIALLKNKLKKHPDMNVKGFFLLIFIFSIVFGFVIGFISIIIELPIFLVVGIFSCFIFLYFLSLGYFFFLNRFNGKKNLNEGILELNDYGVLDKSEDGYQMGISYKNIELVVFTSNVIVFIATTPIVIYIEYNEKYKFKIKEKLKKYKNIQIIDKIDE